MRNTLIAVVLNLVFIGLVPAQPAPPAQTPLDRLKANVERIMQTFGPQWGFYMKCLETGEEIAIDADRQMVEAFRQIEAGKFALTDRVAIQESQKLPGTGIIKSLDAGVNLTVHDLITLMIIVSDNTATDILFEKVGGTAPVNALMRSYGLNSTRATAPARAWFDALRAAPSALAFHAEGKHPFGLSSPRDIGRLLEKIKRAEAVSKQASEEMLKIMRSQAFTSRLPKYVTGYRVPHKTGDFLPYIGNDVGLLESPQRNIVLCVFTAHHNGIGPYLEDAMARITEHVADYFGYRDR